MIKLIKDSILDSSIYTSALTETVEKAKRRFDCQRVGDNVYIGVDFSFVARLSIVEYDALILPVTQRDAGDYVIASAQIGAEPEDLEQILQKNSAGQHHDLKITPLVIYNRYLGSMRKVKTVFGRITTYYSKTGDFVVGVDEDYDSIVRNIALRRSRSAISSIVYYNQDLEPCASMISTKFNEHLALAVQSYCKGEFMDGTAQSE